jgi:hypothetical protein
MPADPHTHICDVDFDADRGELMVRAHLVGDVALDAVSRAGAVSFAQSQILWFMIAAA